MLSSIRSADDRWHVSSRVCNREGVSEALSRYGDRKGVRGRRSRLRVDDAVEQVAHNRGGRRGTGDQERDKVQPQLHQDDNIQYNIFMPIKKPTVLLRKCTTWHMLSVQGHMVAEHPPDWLCPPPPELSKYVVFSLVLSPQFKVSAQ